MTKRVLVTVAVLIGIVVFAVVHHALTPPEPRKYFQLTLQLEINQKPYLVSYNWHCEQYIYGGETIFILPISTHYSWEWRSSAVKMLKKRLDADTFLIFYPPAPESCYRNLTGEHPAEDVSISIVKTTPTAVVGWESFDRDNEKGAEYTVKIKSAVVRRLQAKVADTTSSIDEDSFVQTVNNLPVAYQRVEALVVPASAAPWGSPSIAEYFKNARGIVVAPIPTRPVQKSRGWEDRRAFEVDQSGGDPLATTIALRRYSVSLVREGDVWRLPEGVVPAHRAFSWFTIPYARPSGNKQTDDMVDACPGVTVEYASTLIPVKEAQQIYDADKQLLISFSNTCRALPWGSFAK